MDYWYTQIVDTGQLVNMVADRCKEVGMLPTAHAATALRYHPGNLEKPGSVAKMAPVAKVLLMKTPNISVFKTVIPYIKVFGWDLAVKVDGAEYAIGTLADVAKVFDDYAERHVLIRSHLEKVLLKGHGGPSISRIIYGTIHDIYLGTLIPAVERLGGHVYVRRPKRPPRQKAKPAS